MLQQNPFPEAVTGRNEAVLARLAPLAEDLKSKIGDDLRRLRSGADGDPEDWEIAALERALHEWRVYKAFRRLHKERWCPALLFRLSTKTDLLTLCNRDADSSAAGFDGRVKKVLTKRGIDHRFKWREARQMISAMGLIQPSGTAGDGYAGTPDVAAEVFPNEADATNHAATSTSKAPEEPASSSDEPDPVQDAQTSEAQLEQQDEPGTADLPALRFDRVWSVLPSYTKARLEAVYTRMACGLWTQYADRFYSSFKKAEMLAYVQRLVRFHANLEAVQHLTDQQLDTFFDWMQSHLKERCQRDDDLRIAARLFQDMLQMADLGLLSAEAWNRYREAEVRRIGAFCYHRFFDARTAS